jgi:hypothetical protein
VGETQAPLVANGILGKEITYYDLLKSQALNSKQILKIKILNSKYCFDISILNFEFV